VSVGGGYNAGRAGRMGEGVASIFGKTLRNTR